MGKNQSASNLTNVIQISPTGNVTFVSGSTTLMSISSSGAITTTGVISGSNALSASYASNADVLASSFVAFSSSILAQTASFNAFSASHNSFTASIFAQTASLNTFSASVLTYQTNLNLKTASFATTGSNNFTAVQHIADTTNPTGFDTTASLYTEGGFGIKKDTYISSSLYIKGNLTVYGTQSVSYITSSQLNISTNLITVNTATPSIRFGGLAVIDSGSASGLTGSLLWDSQNNNWLYSNPSGSGNYDSSMVIMGPRNSSTLGSEQGLNCNYLIQGHGSHHTTSSQIYHDSVCTNFYGNSLFVSASGYIGVGTNAPNASLHIYGTPGQNNPSIRLTDSSVSGNGGNVYISADKQGVGYNNLTAVAYSYTFKGGASATNYLTIDTTGISCFANTVCATSFNSSASSTLNGLLVSCNTISNCFTGITVVNYAGAGSDASRAGIAFQAYDWVQSAIWHGRQTNAAFEGALLFGTNPNTANLGVGGVCTRLRINNDGISCFSCQICVGGNIVGASYFDAMASSGFRIRNSGNTANVGGWTRRGLWEGNSNYDPGLWAETGYGLYFYTNGDATIKLKMDTSGASCFLGDICSKTLTTNAGGLNENFSGTGGGHVNRYFAAKYISENTTSAFFRITTSGASATQVHLAATNSAVGWYSGQIYHAANTAYWGGWIGSGASVSLVGTSAGYISGVYSDGAGGQNYCVTVANNGTGTSSLVWAYITTITYAGYSTSFTQL